MSAKPVLLLTYSNGNYRIVRVNPYDRASPSFAIERVEQDTMGDNKWTREAEVNNDNDYWLLELFRSIERGDLNAY